MGAGPRALLNFFALAREAQKVSEIVAGMSGAPVSGVWISRGERAPFMRVTGLSESQESGEAVEGHEPIAVTHGAESKDHGRDERRPSEFQP